MGMLVSYTYVSLDGVMSCPEEWVAPYWSDAMGEDLDRRLSGAAAMVLGRRTYAAFAAYWPQQGSDIAFADRNNQMRKLVVSRSLVAPAWQNSTVIGLAQLVQHKAEGGLHVTGSSRLVRSLAEKRLLDEIVLMQCPCFVGSGQRLFEGCRPFAAQRIATTPFPNGVLAHRFRPAGTPRAESA